MDGSIEAEIGVPAGKALITRGLGCGIWGRGPESEREIHGVAPASTGRALLTSGSVFCWKLSAVVCALSEAAVIRAATAGRKTAAKNGARLLRKKENRFP